MNKNTKGYTLIELLVTISIMISILVLAMISYTKITKNKKEEAYKQVKEEIISAAEYYVVANEAKLKENLEQNGEITVSVNELVKEDLLGRVVDPRTSQNINGCSYVKLGKEGNGIKVGDFVEVTDNAAECKLANNTPEHSQSEETSKKANEEPPTKPSEASTKPATKSNTSSTSKATSANKTTAKVFKKPSVSLAFKVKKDNAYSDVAKNTFGWYNSEALGDGQLAIKVTINKDSGDDVKVYRCSTSKITSCNPTKELSKTSSFYDLAPYKNDTTYKKVCYKIVSTKSKKDSGVKCVSAKVDRVKPSIVNILKPISVGKNESVAIESKAYSNECGTSAIVTAFKVSDSGSKVRKVRHYMNEVKTDISKYSEVADPLAFLSVKAGVVNNILDDSKYMNMFGPSTTHSGNTFVIKRAWASYSSIDTARKKGCGTRGSKVVNILYTKNYCNYVAAIDTAGNKATARFCNDGTEIYGPTN